MYGKSNMETYITICKIWETKHPMGICCTAQESQTGLSTNLEGWDGERDGREVQKGGNICIPMADSG